MSSLPSPNASVAWETAASRDFMVKSSLFYKKCEALGWDTDLTQSITSKVRPDPITGIIEDEDILRFIKSNPHDPDAQRVAQLSAEARGKHEMEKITMPSDIGCSKFQVVPGSLWIIKLYESGRMHDIAKKLGVEAPRHNFHMTCLVHISPWWDVDEERVMEEYIALPDSKAVERRVASVNLEAHFKLMATAHRFIRMAIAKPQPPFKPYLPSHLFLSSKLGEYKSALKPFLDSLPKPFKWSVCPLAKEQSIYEERQLKSGQKYDHYKALAKEKKEVGNRAYAMKDQAGAVDAFMDAISCLQKVSFLLGEFDSTRNALAICLGNCSAARLLDGERRDAKKALDDATMALKIDKNYTKGYVRLSKAYEALGIYSQAEESLARALRRPELENDANLVDCMIALQTDRNGLPTDKEAFEDWSKWLFGNTDSGRRMKTVRGLWRKRCEEHRRVFASQLNLD